MKHKGRLTVVLLLIITLLVVFWGYSYANQQQEKLTSTATSGENASSEQVDTSAESSEVIDISTYEDNRENLSVLEYIKYTELLNGEAEIAFYGQLPEAEMWIDGVVNSIQEQLSSELKTTNLTVSETDSYELYITTAAQQLAETNAGVVFFMLPAEGDQVSDISLADSADYLLRNIRQIQEVLPETLIVMVTPSPNVVQSEDINSRMLSYVEYLEGGVEAANESGLPLLDMHAKFLQAIEEKQLTTEEAVEEDGFTLNDQGQELMSELFEEQLTVPVDTTSGLTE